MTTIRKNFHVTTKRKNDFFEYCKEKNIKPSLYLRNAIQYLVKNESTEEIEDIEEAAIINVNLDKTLNTQLNNYCKNNNTTSSSLIRDIIDNVLNKEI